MSSAFWLSYAEKCQAWFARRGVTPMPRTVEAAIDAAKKAMWPAKISVRREGKYDTIVSYGEWRAAVSEEPKTVEDPF